MRVRKPHESQYFARVTHGIGTQPAAFIPASTNAMLMNYSDRFMRFIPALGFIHTRAKKKVAPRREGTVGNTNELQDRENMNGADATQQQNRAHLQ
jgi:hypothetical protein